METVDRVKSLIEGYLDENGIELVEITYKRGQGAMVLRLLVDTPGNITIDECERLNNYLSEALDKEGQIGEEKGREGKRREREEGEKGEGKGIIDEHFILEVASPGLDRPLVTDRDFTRVMGKELDMRMYEPVDGKREHQGRLIGMDRENIVIESGGISIVIPRAKIARARLRINF